MIYSAIAASLKTSTSRLCLVHIAANIKKNFLPRCTTALSLFQNADIGEIDVDAMVLLDFMT